MPSSKGTAGESAGALMTRLVTRTGGDRVIDGRAFAERDSRSFCAESRRDVEQERRTGGKHGAGRVSRDQWGIDDLFSAERNRAHPLNGRRMAA